MTTSSTTYGMSYHLSYHSQMQTPHIYVTDNNVTHRNQTLSFVQGHEIKLGCFMHCHEEITDLDDRYKLALSIEKIKTCILFTQAYENTEPTRVGKSLALHEQTKDRLQLVKAEAAYQRLIQNQR